MIKAVFLDIDDTLLDFEAFARATMEEGFRRFNLPTYQPYMYDVFDRVEADFLILDIDGILVPFFLEEYRFRSDSVCLVKFCDVDTQQRASELTGCEVYFPRQLADAEDEAPMLAFLVGFEIINAADGNRIGSIVDIDDQTANILFILDNGMLIPASDELISNIDTTSSTITMNIPDGLLEI